MHQIIDGTKSLNTNFPKGMQMINDSKNTITINVDKNKLKIVKPLVKKKIQTKLNKKTEFHRSLEAFSDCV